MIFCTEILNSSHKRKEFSSGNEKLDIYLQRQANQDIKRKLTACFVFLDKENDLIKGYYSLSNTSIPLESIPENIRKKFANSYQTIPTTLLGRLAVDSKYQGQKIGELLLIDALKRSYLGSKSIGSFAVVVDPIDDEAKNFYLKYGFILLPDSSKMFLPMKTIAFLFEK